VGLVVGRFRPGITNLASPAFHFDREHKGNETIMKNLTLLFAAAFSLGLATSSGCDDDGGGANACERAGQRIVDKYEECDVDLGSGDGGGEAQECTDEIAANAACLADCLDPAPCEAVTLDYDMTDPPEDVVTYQECAAEC
jgi:hypothetical protein